MAGRQVKNIGGPTGHTWGFSRCIYRGWRRVLHRSDGRFVSRTWPVASIWRGGFLLRATSCLCVRCRALDGQLHACRGLGDSRRITIADVGRNLAISYIANATGALAFAILIADSGLLQSGYGRTAAAIAEAKMNLGFGPAFVRGILCNALVCVAVWMMVSTRLSPENSLASFFRSALLLRWGLSIQSQTSTFCPLGY